MRVFGIYRNVSYSTFLHLLCQICVLLYTGDIMQIGQLGLKKHMMHPRWWMHRIDLAIDRLQQKCPCCGL
jgi:hypothetical protein